MRKATPGSDFTFSVEGLGDFVYARRTLGDSIKIRARYLELVGEHASDVDLSALATVAATHDVLCVQAPEGWSDLLKIDTLDPANFDRIYALFGALGEKEDSFRGQPKSTVASSGQGTGKDAPVLVSA
jgi:hypothetical protein